MIDKFLQSIADMTGVGDDLVDDKGPEVQKRIEQLIYLPAERNEELWELMGGDIEHSINDYFDIDPLDRDMNWHAGLTVLLSAAQHQAWIEIVARPLIGMTDKANAKIEKQRAKLSAKQLKQASQEGVGPDRYKNGRRAKRQPTKDEA